MRTAKIMENHLGLKKSNEFLQHLVVIILTFFNFCAINHHTFFIFYSTIGKLEYEHEITSFKKLLVFLEIRNFFYYYMFRLSAEIPYTYT